MKTNIKESKVKLPKYVQGAIESKTAKSGNYAFLSEEQWRKLARHIYWDELAIKEGRDKPFLSRGNLNSWYRDEEYGNGINGILDGLLHDAVVNHGGAERHISDYSEVEFLYEANKMGVKIERTEQ